MFSDLTWKKNILLQEMVGWGGGEAGAPPAPLSLRPCIPTEKATLENERFSSACRGNKMKALAKYSSRK